MDQRRPLGGQEGRCALQLFGCIIATIGCGCADGGESEGAGFGIKSERERAGVLVFGVCIGGE
jgi:hypothetical protein